MARQKITTKEALRVFGSKELADNLLMEAEYARSPGYVPSHDLPDLLARAASSVLTADEIETVKALIDDWGFEYSLQADRQKVRALARKLGVGANKVALHLGDDDPETA